MSKVSFAVKCPSCKSFKVWKDGLRKIANGDVQRYICRDCGFRFSKSKNRPSSIGSICQIGAKPQPRLVENLVTVEPPKERLAGATKLDAKGKIVEYIWWLKKQGYAETTIKIYTNAIQVLKKRGANIFDSESVKETIAKQKWGQARKNIVINAYTSFLKLSGDSWNPPIYRKPTRQIPFIPTESELDQLIAACGRKTGVFLQLLKETAMRCGEANRIEWTDVDFQRRIIVLNKPEKNGNPRIFNVSRKLVDMLNSLPRKDKRVFGSSVNWYKSTYYKSRKRIARKLQNQRLVKIHLHTL